MATLVNVALVGEAPRIINLDNMIEVSLWSTGPGVTGTLFKMNCNDSRGEVTGPYKITVSTPFAEIIRRMRFECLRVPDVAPVAIIEQG